MALTGEAKREYQRKWVAARRNAWIEENSPCALCGSNDRLEVDHIDPKTKMMNPTMLWSLSPNNPKRIAELDKCRVLCYDCHQGKSSSEHPSGCDTGHATLTTGTLEEVRQRLSNGDRGIDIARDLGVSKYTISRVKRGIAYA